MKLPFWLVITDLLLTAGLAGCFEEPPAALGRIPVAKAPIAPLAYDSAPYLNRPGVRCYERRKKIISKGVSHGASIRVMKGVYYQPRVLRSEPVEVNEARQIDEGIVALTTQNIYFAGQVKSLRIPYKRVLSFDGYADGFSITRNAESAKPQIFLTGDGWFSYNVVARQAERKHHGSRGRVERTGQDRKHNGTYTGDDHEITRTEVLDGPAGHSRNRCDCGRRVSCPRHERGVGRFRGQ